MAIVQTGTPAEREQFALYAGMLGEMHFNGVTLARLSIRHGIPRALLARELYSHLGMQLASLAAEVDIDRGVLDAPQVPLQAPEEPTKPPRKRDRHWPRA